MTAYPHQLSGGQQQRVVVAMALLAQPALLLLDEPTTSLDVTVEAGIVELIASLRTRYRTALLFISHNLGLVAQVCDRVAVMYSGEIVEEGPVASDIRRAAPPLYAGPDPLHSTTLHRSAGRLVPIPGQVSLPNERPSGCYFGPRCHHFRGCANMAVSHRTAALDAQHIARCRWRRLPTGRAASTREAGRPTCHCRLDLYKDYAVDARSLWAF